MIFHDYMIFQDSACDGCHGLTMLCINISHITIIFIKGVDYRCIIHDTGKYETTHLLENSVLEDPGYK